MFHDDHHLSKFTPGWRYPYYTTNFKSFRTEKKAPHGAGREEAAMVWKIVIVVMAAGLLIEGWLIIENLMDIQRRLCGLRSLLKGKEGQRQRRAGDQQSKNGSPVLKQVLEEVYEEELDRMA